MQTNISTKVAIITGGAKGIGLGIAQRFHQENYQVIILDRDKNTLQECESQLYRCENGFRFFILRV